ncbi:MAG: bifunctional folylpolyglutamate synthase/dihydrofolate synthase [Lachnospiraceae bacterium]|nr:bifunctional folylpolyglutamate synthase/dihydrofolate synthase [Lachnospiraceae bacterium]
MFNSFKEAEGYILDIPKFAGKNEPEVTKEFLQELGDISRSIPTVHVAGTNGKGSVCAYLRAGLMACGYRVGLFTSPHLVDIRERFCIDETMISKKEFTECANLVYERLEGFRSKTGRADYRPSFFEFLFFMGILWFCKKKPDFIILETGLGGRLDATNSISEPRVCVITEIGLDHMEYLGDTKELIAAEKAGIIKGSAYTAFVSRGENWSDVIRNKAKEVSKGFIEVSPENIKNFESTPQGIDFSFHYGYDNCALFSLNTKAVYQAENASLAYGALVLLDRFDDIRIDLPTSLGGFGRMVWEGRMEEVSRGLYLDGAHNEDGVKAFLASAGAILKDSKGSLLFSMVSDKQVETVGTMIADSGLFDRIYIGSLDTPRFAGTSRLTRVFEPYGQISVVSFASVKEAFERMESERGDRIGFVAGSLYLVGEVKAFLSESERGVNSD